MCSHTLSHIHSSVLSTNFFLVSHVLSWQNVRVAKPLVSPKFVLCEIKKTGGSCSEAWQGETPGEEGSGVGGGEAGFWRQPWSPPGMSLLSSLLTPL